MHRGNTKPWLQNKKEKCVRSFQELDLVPGVAVGTRVAQTARQWSLRVFITQNLKTVRGRK